MIRLEEITSGLALTGLEPVVIGSVVAVVPIVVTINPSRQPLPMCQP